MASLFPPPLPISDLDVPNYYDDTYFLARTGMNSGRPSRPPRELISCARLDQVDETTNDPLVGDDSSVRVHPESIVSSSGGRKLYAERCLANYCSKSGACNPIYLRDIVQKDVFGIQQVSKGSYSDYSLRLLQLNLHKGRASTYELNRLEYDIALVQEPNMSNNGKISLVHTPKQYYSKGVARAAVIIGPDIYYWPIDNLSTEDLAVVALALESGNIVYVGSVYLDILRDPILAAMKTLVIHCRCNRIPLILGIDANAHSTLWGSTTPNNRGRLIEEWIAQEGLFVINRGSSPTFTPSTGVRHTIIDITLGNRWSINWVKDWTVKDTTSFSDHRMITYRCNAMVERTSTHKRAYRKVNWDRFRNNLNQMDTSWLKMDWDVNTVASHLKDDLIEVLDQEAPMKRRIFNEGNRWWTPALESLRTDLRSAYKRSVRNNTLRHKYQSLKKDYNKAIKDAKIQAWKNFLSRAESAKEVSKIVKILEDPPNRRMTLLVGNNAMTLSPEDSLKRLLGIHFPDGEIEGHIPHNGESRHDEGVDFTGICQYITVQKVKAAFSSFGDYKSPGPDEIPPIVLKNLGDTHLEIVCLLYKLSLATGIIPDDWKKMAVIFIPKSGKTDYSIAKAYRPITLSNFLLKGIERLIQWYILEHVIIEPFFNQHAYTKGRSCDTALSTFVNDVEYTLNNNKQVVAISLDCSGAFDCIKFQSAETCMVNKGIPSNIIRWYMNLLKQRIVNAAIQGQKAHVIPKRGSPQGGVLSPLVWNIIMDSLLSTFKLDAIKVLGYADDIVIYVIGNTPSVMQEIIQPGPERVVEWGIQNGLTFNPHKTSAVWFSRGHGTPVSNIYLQGVKLNFSESFRYLGVEIHKKLSWHKHVTERANKCKALLMKCRNLVHKAWGLSPSKMEWIHKAIIRPKMTYGAVVWANNLSKTAQAKITKVQRLTLLLITQPLRSTPTAGLEVMMGWIPLHIHAREVGMCTYLKIKSSIQSRWDCQS